MTILKKILNENSHWEKETLSNDLYNFYDISSRQLPWRNDISPYKVLVSEFMLQQTQVTRVINYFDKWLLAFPEITDTQSFEKVLTLWSGLGYNRRAKYLFETIQIINNKYNGIIPNNLEALLSMPGIGEYTARAILTYSFNESHIFIETNIKTFYFFLEGRFLIKNGLSITDTMIKKFIEKMIDKENPRKWYYAIMDIGTILKKNYGEHLHYFKNYKKQTKFEGSDRQIRGMIIKNIISNGKINCNDEKYNTKKITSIFMKLEKENIITIKENICTIK